MKEILEYNGSIHQLNRWIQKLLVYKFIIVHRLAAMIQDVDGVTQYIDSSFTNTQSPFLVYTQRM